MKVEKAGTPEQRLAEGHKRRHRFSRKELGEFEPNKRKTGSLDTLLAATEGRLTKLLPLKYQRMAVSPFAFFRGSVCIMAADFGAHSSTELQVQLCGDAHVQNLGSFASPEGHLIFDINDFDETIAGPWEWDVKRLAASLVLAGREALHKPASCAAAVEAFAESYCRVMEELAAQPVLAAARHLIRRMAKVRPVTAALKQSERATPGELVKKYTEGGSHGKLRFKAIPKVLWRVTGEEKQAVLRSLSAYEETLQPDRRHFLSFFAERDVGFKVAGTGSVALRNYVVLLDGGPADPLFLQIKQEVHSAYAPYIKHMNYDHQGRRVVDGQRRMQALSDLLLGWTSIAGNDYLVRQLNDHKGSVPLETLAGGGLRSFAEVAGEILARGHARSGDAVAIKGYIGGVEDIAKSLVHFAVRYADVTTGDFEAFKRAVEAGRIQAEFKIKT